MRHKVSRGTCCLLLVLLSLAMYSCGLRENPESISISEEDELVPVAQFFDFRLPVPFYRIPLYTFNDDWFYFIIGMYDQEKQGLRLDIYRNDLFGEFEPELYVERIGRYSITMLADRKSNCVLFSQEEDGSFSLKKYDGDGMMQWHTEYSASDLQGQGKKLTDGVITEDGRVFLYAYGEGGSVFIFGQDGSLQGTYVPELEILEGIAESREGRVYGYCITGEEPVFVDVEHAGEKHICPVTPLQVYGGCEDGIYLCDKDGLWMHDPETGETDRMWYWDDEYVQIDGIRVQRIFRGKEVICLMCRERHSDYYEKGEILTFVSAAYGSRRDYPKKEVVTLGRAFNTPYDTQISRMDDLVRQYNRQDRSYRVEILYPEEEVMKDYASQRELLSEMEVKFLRGEGPDLIQVDGLNARSMVVKGVFEDLTGYYEASEVVNREDILQSVRKAGTVMGTEVFVIPSFRLHSMMVKVDVSPEEWTPWRFLELSQGDGAVLYPAASKLDAFWYCMGLRLEGRFLNYERRECYFDNEEFRRILEVCSRWEAAESPVTFVTKEDDLALIDITQPEWIINDTFFNSTSSFIGMQHHNARWLGYPGWEGAESLLHPTDTFAINSASENKEGAWDFLEFLLSEEFQDAIDRDFPVRVDSFERYLAYSYINSDDSYEEFSYKVEPTRLPTEEDFAAMYAMAESAVCGDSLNVESERGDPVRRILEEEAEMYFAGDATLEETVKKIQSRVGLYLNEL